MLLRRQRAHLVRRERGVLGDGGVHHAVDLGILVHVYVATPVDVA
jgi:hypothetical protein